MSVYSKLKKTKELKEILSTEILSILLPITMKKDNVFYEFIRDVLNATTDDIDKVIAMAIQKGNISLFIVKLLKFNTCYGNKEIFKEENVEHLTVCIMSILRNRRDSKDCDFMKEFSDTYPRVMDTYGLDTFDDEVYVEEQCNENIKELSRMSREIRFGIVRYQHDKRMFYDKEVNEPFASDLFYTIFEIMKPRSNVIVSSFLAGTGYDGSEKMDDFLLSKEKSDGLYTIIATEITGCVNDIVDSYYLRPNEISGIVKEMNIKIFDIITAQLDINILMDFNETYTRYTLSFILTNLIYYIYFSVHDKFKNRIMVDNSQHTFNTYLYYLNIIFNNNKIALGHTRGLVNMANIEDTINLLMDKENDVI